MPLNAFSITSCSKWLNVFKAFKKKKEKKKTAKFYTRSEEKEKIDVRFINLSPIRANHTTSTKASSLKCVKILAAVFFFLCRTIETLFCACVCEYFSMNNSSWSALMKYLLNFTSYLLITSKSIKSIFPQCDRWFFVSFSRCGCYSGSLDSIESFFAEGGNARWMFCIHKNRKWRNWWRIAPGPGMYFCMKFKVVFGFCYVQPELRCI